MVDEVREETQAASDTGCLLRAFWMFLGNSELVLLLVLVSRMDSALLSIVSIGFWMVVGLIVYARYVDVTRYKGTTSEGDRCATLLDVKRSSTRQVIIAGAAWVLAHAL